MSDYDIPAAIGALLDANERQVEADCLCLLNAHTSDLPEQVLEDFRITVDKLRGAMLFGDSTAKREGAQPSAVLERIRDLMDDYASDRLDPQHTLNDHGMPYRVFEDVGRLAGMRYRATRHDKYAFLGKGGVAAIESVQQSERARKKRNKRGALWLTIRKLRAPSFGELLEMLEDGDAIEDLYESRGAQINTHAFEVDRAKCTVTYSERDNPKTRQVSLKRLRNIFSETR
jgi:hypothetical protein